MDQEWLNRFRGAGDPNDPSGGTPDAFANKVHMVMDLFQTYRPTPEDAFAEFAGVCLESTRTKARLDYTGWWSPNLLYVPMALGDLAVTKIGGNVLLDWKQVCTWQVSRLRLTNADTETDYAALLASVRGDISEHWPELIQWQSDLREFCREFLRQRSTGN